LEGSTISHVFREPGANIESSTFVHIAGDRVVFPEAINIRPLQVKLETSSGEVIFLVFPAAGE
jgi:hypothetical protein